MHTAIFRTVKSTCKNKLLTGCGVRSVGCAHPTASDCNPPVGNLPTRQQQTRQQWQTRLWSSLASSLVLGLLPIFLSATPIWAAERIVLSYGALRRSVAVADLEVYAKEGRIQGDLVDYAGFFKPAQQEQFRRVLATRIDLSRVAIAQFLYSPQGETLLHRLGQVIQLPSGQSGFYAIRASLILAAGDRNGLTLLNVLRKFPTQGIRIDLEQSFGIVEELTQLVNQAGLVTAALQRHTLKEAAAEPLTDFSRLPDLRSRGRFRWQVQPLMLNDSSRDRNFAANVYLPTVAADLNQGVISLPMVVISHGLGSDRGTFAYLAEHLASHGFVVAVPEHPGSNSAQLGALLTGRAAEVTPPREFIDRPLDITFLLNQLEHWFQTNPLPGVQVNLKQVGVIGQSFGGYTALALAGATLNFPQLQQDCLPDSNPWNISLLLQCSVLSLPPQPYTLRDPRVQAVMAINPIDRSVFGPQGLSQIQIPVMLVGSSADSVAPAVPEQVQPFTWLTTPERYLVIADRGTHFSFLGESAPGSSSLALPNVVIGPDPLIAQRYANALSLAFFQVYTHRQGAFRPYLQASYAHSLSEAAMPLLFVRNFSPQDLGAAIAQINR